jgi:hypothetical protein
MLCTEGDQNVVSNLWLQSGRGEETQLRARLTGGFWGKESAEMSLDHALDGRKVMGGQGHDIEKECRRETVLCCDCIG